MALNFELESLDGLPEAHRELYVQRDGKYVLDVEGAESRTRVTEFRDNNVRLLKENEDLRKAAERFKDIDLDEYQKLLADRRDSREKDLLKKGDVDQIIAERTEAMAAAHKKALDERDGRIAALEGSLSQELIHNRLRQGGIAANVRKEALEDLLMYGDRTWKLGSDGRPVAQDANGQPMFNTDGEPMTIDEWVDARRQDRPHWFEGSSGGGARHGSNNGGGAAQINRRPVSEWSEAEKLSFIKEHGREAYEQRLYQRTG